jgi:uncharacterized protein YbjT (DUF2867 family)
MSILVTGATGTIGSHVVKALTRNAGKDHEVLAAVRKSGTEKAPAGTKAVPLEWDDEASIRAALAGVERAFLLTPFSDKQVEYGKRFVAIAKEAGVKRVVKLSVIGADSEPGITLGRWHREVERALEASGLSYTFLRPTNFMTNFVGFFPPDAEGNIYLPWGDAKVSAIDPADIGEAAARVLTEDGHDKKIYTLVGESLRTKDVAAIIARVSGRKITYVDVPESAANGAMKSAKMPDWMITGMSELSAICKAGYLDTATDDVKTLTGHAPRTFAAFAEAHAAAWKK